MSNISNIEKNYLKCNIYISNTDWKELIEWLKIQFALRYIDEKKININIGLIDYCENNKILNLSYTETGTNYSQTYEFLYLPYETNKFIIKQDRFF